MLNFLRKKQANYAQRGYAYKKKNMYYIMDIYVIKIIMAQCYNFEFICLLKNTTIYIVCTPHPPPPEGGGGGGGGGGGVFFFFFLKKKKINLFPPPPPPPRPLRGRGGAGRFYVRCYNILLKVYFESFSPAAGI